MGKGLLSWWLKIKTHPITSTMIVLFIAFFVLVIFGGYKLNWDWTGFNGNSKSGKTLWDWMQLLIIPFVIAVAGYIINITISRGEQEAAQQRDKTEREITQDNQHEAALQAYITEMSELLLHQKLRVSEQYSEIREIARLRTMTVLHVLDSKRKGIVIQFLHDAGLIKNNDPIIYLDKADLSEAYLFHAWLDNIILVGVDLSKANLERVYLEGTYLTDANLTKANLTNAYLSNADLNEANLEGACLTYALLDGADLYMANLRGATGTTTEQLAKARSLKGATMPDGSIHP